LPELYTSSGNTGDNKHTEKSGNYKVGDSLRMKTNTTCGLDDITTHDERLNDV
jgi:hypothetical protein